MKNRYLNYFVNLMLPAFVFGSVTGFVTSVVITLYKFLAKHVIAFSERCYVFMRGHLYAVVIAFVIVALAAILFAVIYKRQPNIKGGGIPTSIGVLRGVINFKWKSSLIGTFFSSLAVFLIGVPLGNEGPSVQIGTSIGKGSVHFGVKKNRAWSRYTMTGGACAGFSVATGASVSGIMFAIEEAHQRISPMIFIVSSTAVAVSRITSELISPIFGVSVTLFPKLTLIEAKMSDMWIPVVVGILLGLFAVLFLRYYSLIADTLSDSIDSVPHSIKLFGVFALTLIAGLFSYTFISTGHHLIIELLDGHIAFYMLVLILLVRPTLTLLANSNSLTGGIFLPIMAIGAVFSSIIAKLLVYFGIGTEYYTLILVFGITACISAMMKMPLTAIVFAIEALSCYGNLLGVVTVSVIAFIITEIFEVKSVNDSVLENRLEKINLGKEAKVVDTFVTVKPKTFAIGKQVRDIFWPANLFVLSVKHDESHGAEVDGHGGKAISEGDILHVRFSTYDEPRTLEELFSIVGEQEISTDPVTAV